MTNEKTRQRQTGRPSKANRQRAAAKGTLSSETGPETYQEILKRELARKRLRDTRGSGRKTIETNLSY